MKEHPDKGVFIKDLSQMTVKTVPELVKWMNFGNDKRVTGETAMNAESSRSHSVFTVYVETMGNGVVKFFFCDNFF